MNSLASKQGPRYRHASGEEEPYETIAVEKLTPIIGAEISGVEIGRLMSDDSRSNRQMDEIHRALADNLVIFFRDQHISPDQHLAFGRKFGELHVHPAAPVFVDGKKFRTLRGPTIAAEFKALVIDYIDQRYGAGAKPTAAE